MLAVSQCDGHLCLWAPKLDFDPPTHYVLPPISNLEGATLLKAKLLILRIISFQMG